MGRATAGGVTAALGVGAGKEHSSTPALDSPVSPAASLEDAHKVFQRWLGDEYDLDVLDAMLCTLAAERLTGDPLWLLIVSGPGAAKTETAQASRGAGAIVESTISGEAALLSGTPQKEKAKDATGGLLRHMGDHGVLVIKDVTSILSMNRDRRSEVLAAIREVYDGYWSRSLGTDGGRKLSWTGRIAIIGAVTTAWDKAHAVISAMGDRFVLIRMDSGEAAGRRAAARRTLSNTGDEVLMREELSAAVRGVIAGINLDADLSLTEEEGERLIDAADLVTLARTGVETDFQGNVIDAHAPEHPTRFLRQLQQIVRGGLALGMERSQAMRLAVRCARDSMPPMRLAIVDDLAEHPNSTPSDIRRRVGKPRKSVDRQCQALHYLDVVECDEVPYGDGDKVRWHYSLADGINPGALATWPDMSKVSPGGDDGSGASYKGLGGGGNIYGQVGEAVGGSQSKPGLARRSSAVAVDVDFSFPATTPASEELAATGHESATPRRWGTCPDCNRHRYEPDSCDCSAGVAA